MHFTLAFVTAALVTLTIAIPWPLPPRSEHHQYICTGGVGPVCCTRSTTGLSGFMFGQTCAHYAPSQGCIAPSKVFCCPVAPVFGFPVPVPPLPCIAATHKK
ncbi:hypothetical protein BDP27DRAFT_1369921 [Rhodocollybia butyracea]|uniref:Uncharacterized protein n=1 Tax=Rhodocollybia butyracea TaxID=206335 RepID=A0A9P5P9U9_9AGAR|nr:hypothetical protein BDP27DRAFT_1431610 [Rhodocollybia butyracea]KAF9061169.1 hypothetical protein BDP27DRAFT_1369921 [Rhodocollybia butyracea]